MTTTKPIPGWPGYHASDDGRIFSTRGRVHIGGLTWAPVAGARPLTEVAQFDRKSVRGKPTPYRSVCLSRDGVRTNKYVHELVALTFHGERPKGAEILHGSKGSSCNEATNLRYGTPEQNSAERVLCRGLDWYRARGMRPPERFFQSNSSPDPARVVEPEHAFADLINTKESAA